MKSNKNKKKVLIICLFIIMITPLMDSHFYLNYVLNKNDYIIEDAVITNIDYQHKARSGVYESSVDYQVEDKVLTGKIRTDIRDYVGKEITIAVNQDDYSIILPNKYTFEKKGIFHSIFMGGVTIYTIYLVVDLIRKRKKKEGSSCNSKY
jgi:hypothetical protein